MAIPVIVIIETDPLIRFPVAQYLRECGYRVVETVSTEEAITLFTEGGLSADVLLADVKSTGQMGAFGLTRWMREKMPAVKVLLSATTEKVAVEAARLCESGPALSKPYHSQTLLEEIRRELARGQQTPR